MPPALRYSIRESNMTVSYAFNMKGKSGKKIESSFGKEQF
jgi:hypothetical protein